MKTQEQLLEERYPWIRWREPIEVGLMDGSKSGIACRFCIGTIGLKGSEFNPFPDMKAFEQHMREVHGIA